MDGNVFTSLLARESVEWQLPGKRVRFTLRSVSVLDDIRRSNLLEAGRAWLTEEVGCDLTEFVESTQGGQLDRRQVEIYTAMRQVADWASIVVSIERVEEQAEENSWRTIAIPDSWQTFDGFASDMPGDLFLRLKECANRLNPLLWHVPMDDDAKKNASSSANESKDSSSVSSSVIEAPASTTA